MKRMNVQLIHITHLYKMGYCVLHALLEKEKKMSFISLLSEFFFFSSFPNVNSFNPTELG